MGGGGGVRMAVPATHSRFVAGAGRPGDGELVLSLRMDGYDSRPAWQPLKTSPRCAVVAG